MHSEYSKKLSNKRLIDKHHSLLMLDSQFEAFFDAVTSLTAKLCHSPVALVTFIEDDSIWIQSQIGFPDTKMLPNKKKVGAIFPKENDYFEVSHSAMDKMLKKHLFLIENQKTEFYAGAHIRLPLGEMVGVLCVFDNKPRRLTAMQRTYLVGMAKVIEKALVTRNFVKRVS